MEHLLSSKSSWTPETQPNYALRRRLVEYFKGENTGYFKGENTGYFTGENTGYSIPGFENPVLWTDMYRWVKMFVIELLQKSCCQRYQKLRGQDVRLQILSKIKLSKASKIVLSRSSSPNSFKICVVKGI